MTIDLPFAIRRETKVYYFVQSHVMGILNSNPPSRIPQSYDMVSPTCVRSHQNDLLGGGLCGERTFSGLLRPQTFQEEIVLYLG